MRNQNLQFLVQRSGLVCNWIRILCKCILERSENAIKYLRSRVFDKLISNLKRLLNNPAGASTIF
jgi:hypothetical protein